MVTNTTTSDTNAISITAFGAVGDGVTDNQTAIQNAFNYAAANGDSVDIPSGTFAYSGTLTANGINVSGAGSSAILKPLDPSNEALTLTGSGGSASNFQMISSATTRMSAWQTAMIWVDQAQNFTIQNVLINGSSSAGIFDDGGQNGTIQNNTVENTLADSITNTSGASYITVSGNRILNSGDDGISNNSYAGDGSTVNNITVQGNTILDNKWGRGLEVSGGNNITFTGNYVDNTDGYTDMYVASEGQWNTQSVNNVTVSGNTFVDGGPNQGSVLIYNSEPGNATVSGVTVSGNQFVNPQLNAVQFTGNGSETGITVENNTDYSNGQFSSSGNPAASVTQSGNQVSSPSAYSSPMVAQGGGASTEAVATPASGSNSTTPTTAPAGNTSTTITADNTTINATGGNSMLFVTGQGDTFNLSGGIQTITDSGSGGNTFELPAAGNGSAVFNSAALTNGDTFDLSAALNATSWNGSSNTLDSYLQTEQSGGNTELLVSASPSTSATGTLLATFNGSNASLTTILAHSTT